MVYANVARYTNVQNYCTIPCVSVDGSGGVSISKMLKFYVKVLM